MATRPDAAPLNATPFTYRDGRLCLEDVDLTDLAGTLDGRAAWLVSHAAVQTALRAAGGDRDDPSSEPPPKGASSVRTAPAARCIAVSTVGPLAVLGQMAADGWWARVRSSHELTLALEAGFPPERLVAGGGVRDDGFVKDALAAGVAVMEHADDTERANAARIAALLDHALPPDRGAPPHAPSGLLAGCGGLLAPVLRAPPALAIDAVCPRLPVHPQVFSMRGPPEASTGAASAPLPGTVEGLDDGAEPQAAVVPPHVRRGDWVLLPGAAAELRPVDPAHPPASTILVRGESWRLLAARPLPPEPA